MFLFFDLFLIKRYTNVYTAQIFLLQAPIRSKEKAKKFRELLTAKGGTISDELLDDMQRCPIRTYDETVMDDPVARRLKEVLELS